MRNEVIGLMEDLYSDGPGARALLIKIGCRPAQIPGFGSATTFWPEMVIRLDNGLVPDGIRRLLTAATDEHLGSAKAVALLAKVGGPARPAAAPRPVAARPVTVLCLFSDPQRTSIRIDREARLLQEIEGIEVTMRHAVRVTDIIEALLDERPRILHFGGHGWPDGELVFEDDTGAPTDVGPASLATAIVAACDDLLDCVVLNCCYTGGNAEAFRGAARAVAGSVTEIDDDCALAFARGFYTAIGRGHTVGKAYEAGRAQAGLEQCDTSGLHFVSFRAGDPLN